MQIFSHQKQVFAATMLYIMATCLGLSPRPTQANTQTDHSQICDQAAAVVSRQSGVPLDVLMAITLTETGRNKTGELRPWPWTVNMEGKGVWFDTYQQALEYSIKHFERGARSFDVGCFQLNYKWHGQAFTSIAEMFDPIANARYAARFLNELYQEFGDWALAAGAYHSRTPKYANKYKKRFQTIRARLGSSNVPPTAAPEVARVSHVTRVNNFPLLQSGNGQRALGSLFPGVRTGLAFIDGG